jgi:hypothetical protein
MSCIEFYRKTFEFALPLMLGLCGKIDTLRAVEVVFDTKLSREQLAIEKKLTANC